MDTEFSVWKKRNGLNECDIFHAVFVFVAPIAYKSTKLQCFLEMFALVPQGGKVCVTESVFFRKLGIACDIDTALTLLCTIVKMSTQQ